MMGKSLLLRSEEDETTGARWQVQVLTGDRGRAAGGAPERRFDEFMGVKNADITAAAVALSRRAGGLGLPTLSPEERQRYGRPGTVARPLRLVLARAVKKQPLIEQRAGVTGDELLLWARKEEELLAAGAGLGELRRQVGDSRRVLQCVQYEAQQRVLACVARLLLGATPAERVSLLSDAGPLLDAVDAQLEVIRDGQKAGDRASAEHAEAQAEADEDLLLMSTLRALQAGEPVDEDVLRRAAKRFADRGAPTVKPPEPQQPAGKAAGKPAAQKPRKPRRPS